MSDIVKSEAINFFEHYLFSGQKRNTLEVLKDKIETKLYQFKRERDKIVFLKTLKPLIIESKVTHEKTCTTKDCDKSKEHEVSIYLVDHEIEEIQNSYTYQETYGKENSFTPEEAVEMNSRLDKLEEMLVNLGLGQEIIFDEIGELKAHLNIGKRNWFQFAKVKLVDVSAEKVIEKSVINTAWNMLKEGFDSASKLIE